MTRIIVVALTFFIACRPSSPRSDPVEHGAPAKSAATELESADTAHPTSSTPSHQESRSANVESANETLSSITALFDGKSLDGWKETQFAGGGECLVDDGLIILEAGFPLTGITSTLENLPTSNYEIIVEARKTQGIDFFCGLTFPVNESHCSLIVGGWAGTLVGLSMIDGQDAAHNETRRLMKFEHNRWYTIRLRVEPHRIAAWIDDEMLVDQIITNRTLSVRNETLPSRPLGICSFETRAEIRRVELRIW